ncbi:hypothetical protein [Cryobacterium sp. Sr8]|uniref:hypothetical protein n=1 Tax=Cryobacterium sp. Sr8 TaxID=1259203 RepID=UPI00141B6A88|nr:hypothetical protein [Cryobacterium sp. Sr8]
MLSTERSTHATRGSARRRFAAILAAGALVAASITVPAAAYAEVGASTDPVAFGDVGLEACVANQLGIGAGTAVTQGDLGLLTALDCPGADISDLGPLQFATNLMTLNVAGNAITDLTALAGLSHLTDVTLTDQVVPLADALAGLAVDLPVLAGAHGEAIVLDVSSSSGTVGTVAGNAVTWACAGAGRLDWLATVPLGDLGATTTFTGSMLQQVAQGTAPACALTASPSPIIKGTPRSGQTLTVSPGSWAPEPVALATQWKSAGVAIPGATASTYVVLATDAGKAITVTVTGSKLGYTSMARTSAALTMESTLTASPTPTVSGARRVGQVLTATAGSWTPTVVTLAYQWKRNGVAIPGATTSTYKLVTVDAGTQVTAVVTGYKSGYTTVSRTSAAASIEKLLTASPVPSISGTGRVGKTLTANPGSWTPATVTLAYRWITGATASTYVVVAADAGRSITVTVAGSKSGYTSVSRTSAALRIEKPLTATPTPTVSGTRRVGQVLTATAGSWTPTVVTLAYQWKRNGVAISGATTTTYKLVTADAGTQVTAVVTGSKSGYTPVSRTSAAASIEKLLTATPVPSISGTGRVGRTLTAKPGSWTPATVTLAYRWKRDGASISGATASTYTLVTADAGRLITVTVSGSKSGYTTASRTSPALRVEKLLTAAPTPTISGVAATARKLTANPGIWSPSPVVLTYQWMRNGIVISGATASTYVPSGPDVGKRILVVVRGSKLGYTSKSRVSAATAAIVISTAIPSDGTYRMGYGLSAGTYVTRAATAGCYWERLSGFDGLFDSIITNDYGSGQRIVTISASDAGFSTSDCGSWIRLKDATFTPRTTVPSVGLFSVARQITPGLYSAPGGDGCYWETLSGFEGGFDPIIANDFSFYERQIVRIDSWAVGFQTEDCGAWTRIGD